MQEVLVGSAVPRVFFPPSVDRRRRSDDVPHPAPPLNPKHRKTQLQLSKNSGPNFESLDDISGSLGAEPSGRMEPGIPSAVVL